MSTSKQKKYVKLKIVDDSSTEKSLLARAGYSEATQVKPIQVYQSQGVQELLAKAQSIDGLDDKTLLEGISKAIKAQFTRNNADYALRWLQLLYSNKVTDNRSVTNITITNADVLDQAIELVNTGLNKRQLEIIDNQVSKIL